MHHKRKLHVESLEKRDLLAVDIYELEPNNTPFDAVTFAETGTLRGSFAAQDDVDYFRFNLSQGEAISVDPIYGDTTGGDRQIFVPFDILNEAGATIVRSQDVWTSQFVATTAGTYFLRIHADNPYGPLNHDYALRQTISPFVGVTEQEPNDSTSQATAIASSTSIRGQLQDPADTDVFSIEAQTNEIIVVDFATQSPAPRVDLIASDGTLLASDSQGLGLTFPSISDEVLTLRFTQPTSPLAMLDYVANVVVRNNAQLVPELGNGFAEASTDWTLLPETTRRIGVLQDLDDVDVIAVNGRGLETFAFDLRFNSTDSLSLAGRRISLYNEYGQLMAYADGRTFGHGEAPALSTPGRYFVTVQATSPLGLGAYALSGSTNGMLSNQRDVPLYFFDFDQQVAQHKGRDFEVAYGNPDAIPFLVGWFEAHIDRFDVDVTTQLPVERTEYISQGIGQFEGSGNSGSGSLGTRRVTGDSIADIASSYSTGTIMHEILHASTLNHVRGTLQQIARGNLGKGVFPGTHYNYGGANSLVSGSLTFNPIDQLDWALQSGSQSREAGPGDGVLNLNSLLAEMEVEFTNGPFYQVDAAPHQVASGDFDGDGLTDLATANASGTVSILFGLADGSLSDPISLAVGKDAKLTNTLLVIDVNNDGRSDVIHANYEVAGTISVQLGNADRSFTDSVSFPAGSRPNSLVSADFDNDGNLDVAVANYFSHTVSILSGAGDGTFVITNTLTTAGSRARELELVDLNNDTVPDLVVTDQLGGTVTTFLGQNNGMFGAAADHAIEGKPVDVAAVDLNGDAFLDLAVNDFDGKIYLYASDGSGGLSLSKTMNSSPGAAKIESADINGDGLKDLIVPAADSLALDILIHLGGTIYSRPIKYHAGGARESSVLVTDWNADGNPDIWVTDSRKDNLRLLIGQHNDARNDRAVIHGQINTSEGADTYELTVEAGSTFSFDIDAAEFQYPLDAGLVVYDSTGKLIAFNAEAIDRESGFDSVDPYLVHTFEDAGTYSIKVVPQFNTAGKYRLKVSGEAAVDRDGPRLLRASPEQGESINQTRQLLFWFNDQLDPASLTNGSIRIVGASTGAHAGSAEFDPIFNVLVWRSDAVLPVDNYTVVLDGVTDLHGNALDGESSDVRFPAISGDGHAGGALQYTFSISAPDLASASLSSLDVSRGLYNTHLIALRFSEHMDVVGTQQNRPVLTAAGPDDQFDTADDWTIAIDVLNNRLFSYADLDGRYFAMTRGYLSPGSYRLEGNLIDEAGLRVELSEEFVVDPMDLTHGVSVVDMNYQPGSFTSTNQRESIQVRFSSPIDLDTLTPDNFKVWYSDDARFFETSDVPVQDADDLIEWDLHSLTATFRPAEPLSDGFYLVELNGDTDGIADRNANLLDGEFLDSNVNGSSLWSIYPDLASGDGRAGGDYRAFFGLGASQADQAELTVSLSAESISEKDGDTTLVVSRNGVSGDLHVTLLLDDASEVTLPGGIVIPDGQTSSLPIAVNAIDDPLLDGTQTITIVATADGYDPAGGFLKYSGQAHLDVTDHERLTLTLDRTSVDEGSEASVTISRSNSNIASPLTVALFNGDPTEIHLPEFATIPGNATSVTVQIAAVEDMLPDGPQMVTIVASVSGYSDGTGTLQVTDPEKLTVTIDVDLISENGGVTTGTVSRSNVGDLSLPLTVVLSSDDTSEVAVDLTVQIPAGVAAASFNITAVDDALLDGTQTVTIVASAAGYSDGTDTLQVTDYETLTVTIDADSISEKGGLAMGRVSRSDVDDLSQPVTISLFSDDSNQAVVDLTVEIPAEAASVLFPITAVDDIVVEDTVTVIISASASDFTAHSDTIEITDEETFQNPFNRYDVNREDGVTPLDALNVINYLGLADVHGMPERLPGDEDTVQFYDVSGDGNISPLDALHVINFLARQNLFNDTEPEAAGTLTVLQDDLLHRLRKADPRRGLLWQYEQLDLYFATLCDER